VVEILSPNAETFAKFDFYGGHGVEEILVADLDKRSIRLWRSDGGSWPYRPADDSLILGTSAAGITAAGDWPRSTSS
jgi:Uma2 family endonuclease